MAKLTGSMTLSDRNLDCRGRNGYFNGHALEVWRRQRWDQAAKDYSGKLETQIIVLGSRGGYNIVITLTEPERRQLHDLLAKG